MAIMDRIRISLIQSFLVLVGVVGMASAETIDLKFQVTAPDSAAGLSIFLAGNFQGWNPGDPDYLLDDLGNGLYDISLSFEVNKFLQFKFTQGTWGKVEKGPDGEEISNRSLRVQDSGLKKYHVAAWAHEQPAKAQVSTVSGDVNLIKVPDFLAGRDVLVYLPSGYHDSTDTHFPVLYMFDGQNVFDEATSFAGEWKVDESCESLVSQGKMRSIIVVAIANGREQRIYEYTPWADLGFRDGKSGGGEYHMQTIVDDLVPYINQTYRTLSGPQNTGLAGSSLGGLMTIYAAGNFRETFGLFAALSPSLWWKNRYPKTFAEQSIQPGIRLYLDMGGRENSLGENSGSYSLNVVRLLKETLEKNGFGSDDLLVVEDGMGTHNEASWARRFPQALKFLFPAETVGQ